MSGILEKGNSGLFNNEIEFQGKYARMARYLKEDAGIFTTFREIYVIGAVIGFLKNCEDTGDASEKIQTASIFPAELSKKKRELRFIYRLIMLLKEEPNFTIEDYQNRAFRDDPEENADIVANNMKIFNSYACGGVEYLYDQFKNIDRLDDRVDKLHELISEFGEEVGLIDAGDGELPDFDPNDVN